MYQTDLFILTACPSDFLCYLDADWMDVMNTILVSYCFPRKMSSQISVLFCLKSREQKYPSLASISAANLHKQILGPHPWPNFFIFMRFLGKLGQIISLHLFFGWRPPRKYWIHPYSTQRSFRVMAISEHENKIKGDIRIGLGIVWY